MQSSACFLHPPLCSWVAKARAVTKLIESPAACPMPPAGLPPAPTEHAHYGPPPGSRASLARGAHAPCRPDPCRRSRASPRPGAKGRHCACAPPAPASSLPGLPETRREPQSPEQCQSPQTMHSPSPALAGTPPPHQLSLRASLAELAPLLSPFLHRPQEHKSPGAGTANQGDRCLLCGCQRAAPSCVYGAPALKTCSN